MGERAGSGRADHFSHRGTDRGEERGNDEEIGGIQQSCETNSSRLEKPWDNPCVVGK